MASPPLRALLIGIDHWINSTQLRSLAGCVHDVELMASVLKSSFGAVEEDVRILRDEEATKQQFLGAIREHLIDHAKEWHQSGRPEPAPAYLFHYSGHGSRAYAGKVAKMTRYDETVVPHDSRQSEVTDIRDYELGAMFDELAEYTDNVTVVMDCCHSGSGLRNDDDLGPRKAPADERRELLTQSQTAGSHTATRSAGEPSALHHSDDKWVLLASCQFDQVANEVRISVGDKERVHGAMTHALATELASLPSQRDLTYRELMERVSDRVRASKPSQWPKCEGDRDRLLFNGLRRRRSLFLRIESENDGVYWVDGGLSQNLVRNTELVVYPPSAAVEDDAEPLGRLRVTKPDAVRSGCIPVEPFDVPSGARIAVDEATTGLAQLSIAFDSSAESIRQELTELLADDPLGRRIEVVSQRPADIVVEVMNDRVVLADRLGGTFLIDSPVADLGEAVRLIRGRIQYLNARAIRNGSTQSELDGLVEVQVLRASFDADENLVYEPFAASAAGEIVIEEDSDGFCFEILNRSPKPLYLTLLHFAYDGSITQLLPATRGEHLIVEPGDAARTEASYASFHEGDERVHEGRETVKVFATVKPLDFEVLLRGRETSTSATRSSEVAPTSMLDLLINDAAVGSGKRYIRPIKAKREIEDWTTADSSFRLIRKLKHGEQRVAPGESASFQDYDLTISTPKGVEATVSVASTHQAVRAAMVESVGQSVPLRTLHRSPLAELGSRISLNSTRAGGTAGDEVVVSLDSAAASKISVENPIRIEAGGLSLHDDETVLVLATDGDMTYVVGGVDDAAAGRTSLSVDWLPAAETLPEGAVHELSTRSVIRTVSLYLFKSLGWPTPSLGLKVARFVASDDLASDDRDKAGTDLRESTVSMPAGEVRMRPAEQGEAKSGHRVALLVHGFQSDTRWMVPEVDGLSRAAGVDYDFILTFDYESLGETIRSNGKRLADALTRFGLSGDDGVIVDVFAHSMGTIVTRTAIELHGAGPMIDRCLLAGPPNRGTVLANHAKLLPWFGTVLVNATGVSLAGVVASWVMQRAKRGAAGPMDLRTDSEVFRELAAAIEHRTVPYLMLAGANAAESIGEGRLEKMKRAVLGGLDAVLDQLFGDQHDLVIAMSSMRDVGDDGVTSAESSVVACDHFTYFSDVESRKVIQNWIAAGLGVEDGNG